MDTQRKQWIAGGSQHEPSSRERLLQTMLENVTDVVLDIAPDNTYRWVSPAVREVLGWDPADVVGHDGSRLPTPRTTSKFCMPSGRRRPPAKVRGGTFPVSTGGRRLALDVGPLP